MEKEKRIAESKTKDAELSLHRLMQSQKEMNEKMKILNKALKVPRTVVTLAAGTKKDEAITKMMTQHKKDIELLKQKFGIEIRKLHIAHQAKEQRLIEEMKKVNLSKSIEQRRLEVKFTEARADMVSKMNKNAETIQDLNACILKLEKQLMQEKQKSVKLVQETKMQSAEKVKRCDERWRVAIDGIRASHTHKNEAMMKKHSEEKHQYEEKLLKAKDDRMKEISLLTKFYEEKENKLLTKMEENKDHFAKKLKESVQKERKKQKLKAKKELQELKWLHKKEVENLQRQTKQDEVKRERRKEEAKTLLKDVDVGTKTQMHSKATLILRQAHEKERLRLQKRYEDLRNAHTNEKNELDQLHRQRIARLSGKMRDNNRKHQSVIARLEREQGEKLKNAMKEQTRLQAIHRKQVQGLKLAQKETECNIAKIHVAEIAKLKSIIHGNERKEQMMEKALTAVKDSEEGKLMNILLKEKKNMQADTVQVKLAYQKEIQAMSEAMSTLKNQKDEDEENLKDIIEYQEKQLEELSRLNASLRSANVATSSASAQEQIHLSPFHDSPRKYSTNSLHQQNASEEKIKELLKKIKDTNCFKEERERALLARIKTMKAQFVALREGDQSKCDENLMKERNEMYKELSMVKASAEAEKEILRESLHMCQQQMEAKLKSDRALLENNFKRIMQDNEIAHEREIADLRSLIRQQMAQHAFDLKRTKLAYEKERGVIDGEIKTLERRPVQASSVQNNGDLKDDNEEIDDKDKEMLHHIELIQLDLEKIKLENENQRKRQAEKHSFELGVLNDRIRDLKLQLHEPEEKQGMKGVNETSLKPSSSIIPGIQNTDGAIATRPSTSQQQNQQGQKFFLGKSASLLSSSSSSPSEPPNNIATTRILQKQLEDDLKREQVSNSSLRGEILKLETRISEMHVNHQTSLERALELMKTGEEGKLQSVLKKERQGIEEHYKHYICNLRAKNEDLRASLENSWKRLKLVKRKHELELIQTQEEHKAAISDIKLSMLMPSCVPMTSSRTDDRHDENNKGGESGIISEQRQQQKKEHMSHWEAGIRDIVEHVDELDIKDQKDIGILLENKIHNLVSKVMISNNHGRRRPIEGREDTISSSRKPESVKEDKKDIDIMSAVAEKTKVVTIKEDLKQQKVVADTSGNFESLIKRQKIEHKLEISQLKEEYRMERLGLILEHKKELMIVRSSARQEMEKQLLHLKHDIEKERKDESSSSSTPTSSSAAAEIALQEKLAASRWMREAEATWNKERNRLQQQLENIRVTSNEKLSQLERLHQNQLNTFLVERTRAVNKTRSPPTHPSLVTNSLTHCDDGKSKEEGSSEVMKSKEEEALLRDSVRQSLKYEHEVELERIHSRYKNEIGELRRSTSVIEERMRNFQEDQKNALRAQLQAINSQNESKLMKLLMDEKAKTKLAFGELNMLKAQSTEMAEHANKAQRESTTQLLDCKDREIQLLKARHRQNIEDLRKKWSRQMVQELEKSAAETKASTNQPESKSVAIQDIITKVIDRERLLFHNNKFGDEDEKQLVVNQRGDMTQSRNNNTNIRTDVLIKSEERAETEVKTTPAAAALPLHKPPETHVLETELSIYKSKLRDRQRENDVLFAKVNTLQGKLHELDEQNEKLLKVIKASDARHKMETESSERKHRNQLQMVRKSLVPAASPAVPTKDSTNPISIPSANHGDDNDNLFNLALERDELKTSMEKATRRMKKLESEMQELVDLIDNERASHQKELTSIGEGHGRVVQALQLKLKQRDIQLEMIEKLKREAGKEDDDVKTSSSSSSSSLEIERIRKMQVQLELQLGEKANLKNGFEEYKLQMEIEMNNMRQSHEHNLMEIQQQYHKKLEEERRQWKSQLQMVKIENIVSTKSGTSLLALSSSRGSEEATPVSYPTNSGEEMKTNRATSSLPIGVEQLRALEKNHERERQQAEQKVQSVKDMHNDDMIILKMKHRMELQRLIDEIKVRDSKISILQMTTTSEISTGGYSGRKEGSNGAIEARIVKLQYDCEQDKSRALKNMKDVHEKQVNEMKEQLQMAIQSHELEMGKLHKKHLERTKILRRQLHQVEEDSEQRLKEWKSSRETLLQEALVGIKSRENKRIVEMVLKQKGEADKKVAKAMEKWRQERRQLEESHHQEVQSYIRKMDHLGKLAEGAQRREREQSKIFLSQRAELMDQLQQKEIELLNPMRHNVQSEGEAKAHNKSSFTSIGAQQQHPNNSDSKCSLKEQAGEKHNKFGKTEIEGNGEKDVTRRSSILIQKQYAELEEKYQQSMQAEMRKRREESKELLTLLQEQQKRHTDEIEKEKSNHKMIVAKLMEDYKSELQAAKKSRHHRQNTQGHLMSSFQDSSSPDMPLIIDELQRELHTTKENMKEIELAHQSQIHLFEAKEAFFKKRLKQQLEDEVGGPSMQLRVVNAGDQDKEEIQRSFSELRLEIERKNKLLEEKDEDNVRSERERRVEYERMMVLMNQQKNSFEKRIQVLMDTLENEKRGSRIEMIKLQEESEKARVEQDQKWQLQLDTIQSWDGEKLARLLAEEKLRTSKQISDERTNWMRKMKELEDSVGKAINQRHTAQEELHNAEIQIKKVSEALKREIEERDDTISSALREQQLEHSKEMRKAFSEFGVSTVTTTATAASSIISNSAATLTPEEKQEIAAASDMARLKNQELQSLYEKIELLQKRLNKTKEQNNFLHDTVADQKILHANECQRLAGKHANECQAIRKNMERSRREVEELLRTNYKQNIVIMKKQFQAISQGKAKLLMSLMEEEKKKAKEGLEQIISINNADMENLRISHLREKDILNSKIEALQSQLRNVRQGIKTPEDNTSTANEVEEDYKLQDLRSELVNLQKKFGQVEQEHVSEVKGLLGENQKLQNQIAELSQQLFQERARNMIDDVEEGKPKIAKVEVKHGSGKKETDIDGVNNNNNNDDDNNDDNGKDDESKAESLSVVGTVASLSEYESKALVTMNSQYQTNNLVLSPNVMDTKTVDDMLYVVDKLERIGDESIKSMESGVVLPNSVVNHVRELKATLTKVTQERKTYHKMMLDASKHLAMSQRATDILEKENERLKSQISTVSMEKKMLEAEIHQLKKLSRQKDSAAVGGSSSSRSASGQAQVLLLSDSDDDNSQQKNSKDHKKNTRKKAASIVKETNANTSIISDEEAEGSASAASGGKGRGGGGNGVVGSAVIPPPPTTTQLAPPPLAASGNGIPPPPPAFLLPPGGGGGGIPPPPPPGLLGVGVGGIPPPPGGLLNFVPQESLEDKILKEHGLEKPQDFVPKQKMKKLHWNKIKVGDIPESVWLPINKQLVEQKKQQQLLLKSMDLGDVFAERKLGRKKKKEASGIKKIVKLIDSKRDQNVKIALNALKMPPDRILNALIGMHQDVLPLDSLNRISSVFPNDEELRKVMSYRGNVAQLGQTERLFRTLGSVYGLETRLQLFQFTQEFPTLKRNLERNLMTARAGFEAVLHSKALQGILSTLLQYGNYMNSGSRLGKAYGFTLKTLELLSGLKSTDNKTNLMQHLVRDVTKKGGLCARFLNEMKGIPAAAGIDSSHLNQQFQKMKDNISLLKESLKERPSNLPKWQRARPYPSTAFEFYKTVKKDVERIEEMFAQCSMKFERTQKYLVDEEKKWEEMFQKLAEFLVNFKKAQMEVQKKDKIKQPPKKGDEEGSQQTAKPNETKLSPNKSSSLKGGIAEKKKNQTKNEITIFSSPEELKQMRSQWKETQKKLQKALEKAKMEEETTSQDFETNEFSYIEEAKHLKSGSGVVKKRGSAAKLTSREIDLLKRHLQGLADGSSSSSRGGGGGEGNSRSSSVAGGSIISLNNSFETSSTSSSPQRQRQQQQQQQQQQQLRTISTAVEVPGPLLSDDSQGMTDSVNDRKEMDNDGDDDDGISSEYDSDTETQKKPAHLEELMKDLQEIKDDEFASKVQDAVQKETEKLHYEYKKRMETLRNNHAEEMEQLKANFAIRGTETPQKDRKSASSTLSASSRRHHQRVVSRGALDSSPHHHHHDATATTNTTTEIANTSSSRNEMQELLRMNEEIRRVEEDRQREQEEYENRLTLLTQTHENEMKKQRALFQQELERQKAEAAMTQNPDLNSITLSSFSTPAGTQLNTPQSSAPGSPRKSSSGGGTSNNENSKKLKMAVKYLKAQYAKLKRKFKESEMRHKLEEKKLQNKVGKLENNYPLPKNANILEQTLAATKLRLAQIESERDDLEDQIAVLREGNESQELAFLRKETDELRETLTSIKVDKQTIEVKLKLELDRYKNVEHQLAATNLELAMAKSERDDFQDQIKELEEEMNAQRSLNINMKEKMQEISQQLRSEKELKVKIHQQNAQIEKLKAYLKNLMRQQMKK